MRNATGPYHRAREVGRDGTMRVMPPAGSHQACKAKPEGTGRVMPPAGRGRARGKSSVLAAAGRSSEVKDRIIKAIHHLQAKYNIAIPQEYVRFHADGVVWIDDLMEMPVLDLEYENYSGCRSTDIVRPYPLIKNKPSPLCSVEEINDIFRSRKLGEGVLPDGCIAIAGTQCGEEVLLFTSTRRVGEVWLKSWFQFAEKGHDDPEADVFRLASSFTEFLKILGQTSDTRKT